MTPLEKLQNEFPAEILAEMQEAVNHFKSEYDKRDYDYVEYMEGRGNEIGPVKRGTEDWRDWMRVRKDRVEHDVSVRCREFVDVEAWHSHLTGNREATYECPGWRFETFRDAIRAAIEDVVQSYALADIGEEAYDEWQYEVASHLQIHDEILDECVDYALAGNV